MREENITKYILMNKNTPVLEFEYDLKRHEPVRVIKEINLDYAPFSIFVPGTKNPDVEMMDIWWKNRMIPASRKHLRFSTDSISGVPSGKINMKVIYGLVEKNFGLSLSDQYWVNDCKDPSEWKDINFFHNEFSDDVGKILLGVKEKISPREAASLNLRAPDGTANGNLRKGWKIVDGKRVLFKAGTGESLRAPYNELIATKLCERLLEKGEFVEYDLLEEKNKVYSVCENMLTDNEELIPAAQIVDFYASDSRNDYQSYVLGCEEFGIKNYEEKLSKMVACDFIIANDDRHLNNFGLIRNVETLECRIAPLFDNGNSLLLNAEFPEDTRPFDFYVQAFMFDDIYPTTINVERFAPDLSWFDAGKLKGFSEEARDILESSRFAKELSPDFVFKVINNICYGLEQRIDFVRERQLELSRTQTSVKRSN